MSGVLIEAQIQEAELEGGFQMVVTLSHRESGHWWAKRVKLESQTNEGALEEAGAKLIALAKALR